MHYNTYTSHFHQQFSLSNFTVSGVLRSPDAKISHQLLKIAFVVQY